MKNVPDRKLILTTRTVEHKATALNLIYMINSFNKILERFS